MSPLREEESPNPVQGMSEPGWNPEASAESSPSFRWAVQPSGFKLQPILCLSRAQKEELGRRRAERENCGHLEVAMYVPGLVTLGVVSAAVPQLWPLHCNHLQAGPARPPTGSTSDWLYP